jgi:DNA-binding NarL/FixJ family response regulator
LVANLSQLKQEVERLNGKLKQAQNELDMTAQEIAQKGIEGARVLNELGHVMSQVEQLRAQKERLNTEVNELKKSHSGEVRKEPKGRKGKANQEQVLNLLSQGLTQSQVAQKLKVSLSTVKRLNKNEPAEVATNGRVN